MCNFTPLDGDTQVAMVFNQVKLSPLVDVTGVVVSKHAPILSRDDSSCDRRSSYRVRVYYFPENKRFAVVVNGLCEYINIY